LVQGSNFNIFLIFFGMLVAFKMFSCRLSQPVMRLVGLWQEFQHADIAVKRLGDVMNAPA
jgi:ATP-binding cassette, subfamily B, bacterial HlyB/CyaB